MDSEGSQVVAQSTSGSGLAISLYVHTNKLGGGS
jgi:hypothetical protein